MTITRWIRWFLAGLALGVMALQGNAQTLRIDRAIFEDTSGQMRLEQVRQAQFSSDERIMGRGYSRSALWIRFTLQVPGDVPALVLRVTPPSLDEVTLFSPGLPARTLTERSLQLAVPPGQSHHYLRIQSAGSLLVTAQMLTVAQAQAQDLQRAFILGAVLACGAPLMLGIVALIVRRREGLHLAFLANFCVSVVFFLGWFGYLREFFGPQHWMGGSASIQFLGIVNIFTAFVFFRLLLGSFGLPHWGRQLFNVFFLLDLPLMGLFFVLQRQDVLAWNTLLGLFGSTFCSLLALRLVRRQRPATWLIAALILLGMGLLFRSLLIAQGWVAADDSSINLLAYRVFFLAGVFVSIFILMDHDKEQLIQTSRLNETVARRLAESEKARRQVQERFMTMLMHELKTPLAIVQLAAASLGRHLAPGGGDATRVANIQRAVDDLNALIERCAQADQIEHGAAPLERTAFSLQALLDDLLRTLGAERIRLVGPQAGRLVSDYQYVRLVLLNLLSNALKYSPPETLVAFEVERTGAGQTAGVRFRILNAVGAAGRPDPAQVFERYYRSDAARGQVGAGLGLWLAQAVARQLGSQVHFQATAQQVVFSFSLDSFFLEPAREPLAA